MSVYHCIFLAKTLRGHELRRFRTSADPNKGGERGKAEIVLELMNAWGIDVNDLVEENGVPPVALLSFDTEAECKTTYDKLVRLAAAQPN